jgi:OmpA-OmpF porin, OOP family
LVRRGIADNEIVILWKGEAKNLVPTEDGIREPQNRRVEIVID